MVEKIDPLVGVEFHNAYNTEIIVDKVTTVNKGISETIVYDASAQIGSDGFSYLPTKE